MPGRIRKRSLTVAGHRTSVSLEDDFWRALNDAARDQGRAPSDLVASIDAQRRHASLSSAIRLYLLDYYRRRA